MSRPKAAPRAAKSSVHGTSDDIPRVNIRPPRDYTAVPVSYLSLLCGHGTIASGSVLVPYVDLRVMRATDLDAEEEGGEPPNEEAYRATLAYENMAYFLMDMAHDFRAATRRLGQMSGGDLKPEPRRLKYSSECLELARTFLEGAVEDLERMQVEIETAGVDGETSSSDQPATSSKPGARTIKPRPAAKSRSRQPG